MRFPKASMRAATATIYLSQRGRFIAGRIVVQHVDCEAVCLHWQSHRAGHDVEARDLASLGPTWFDRFDRFDFPIVPFYAGGAEVRIGRSAKTTIALLATINEAIAKESGPCALHNAVAALSRLKCTIVQDDVRTRDNTPTWRWVREVAQQDEANAAYAAQLGV